MLKILITGASRGIGRHIALEFAQHDCAMTLLARTEEKLIELQDILSERNTKSFISVCDVSNREQMQDSIKFAMEKMGGIDIAILNAGVSGSGYFENYDTANLNRIFDVNVFGLSYGLEALIPIMKKQGQGIIVGVSSLAEARGVPGNAIYCASKSSVSFLLEAARIELKKFGIKVISVKPGFVKSDMTAKHTFHMPLLMETDKAAKIIVDGIMTGKKQITFPMPMVFLSWLGKVVPAAIFEYFISLWGKPISE